MPSAVKWVNRRDLEIITKEERSKKGKHGVREAKIKKYLIKDMVPSVSWKEQFKETELGLLRENMLQNASRRDMIL